VHNSDFLSHVPMPGFNYYHARFTKVYNNILLYRYRDACAVATEIVTEIGLCPYGIAGNAFVYSSVFVFLFLVDRYRNVHVNLYVRYVKFRIAENTVMVDEKTNRRNRSQRLALSTGDRRPALPPSASVIRLRELNRFDCVSSELFDKLKTNIDPIRWTRRTVDPTLWIFVFFST